MINLTATKSRLARYHKVNAARFEKPLILFHGTSSRYTRSILKHGLTPAAKEGRWVQEDENASEHNRSRISYGGVYFTTNLQTATSAASNLIIHQEGNWQDRKSNTIIVCAQIQLSSTIGDEDDYKSNLFEAIRIPETMIPNILVVLRAKITLNNGYGAKEWTQQAYDYINKNVEALMQKYAPSYDLRRDKSRLYPLAQEVLLTELERQIAYRSVRNGVKPHYAFERDAKQNLDRMNYPKGGWPHDKPLPQAMRPQSKEKAEQRARQALDLFIKATKSYSKQNLEEQRDQTYTRGTTRTLDAVTFSGSNKIICIVEFVNNAEKYGNDLVVHYGTIPAEFKRQYVQSKGPWPKVMNKTGEVVEASDAQNVNSYSIKYVRTESDGSPGDIDYYHIDYNGKPIVPFRITKLDHLLEIDIDDGYENRVNKLGPTVLRKLLKDIKKLYPQAEQLVGLRTTGSRVKSGKMWDEASIKLHATIRLLKHRKLNHKVISSTLNDVISLHKLGETETTHNPMLNEVSHTHKYQIHQNGKPINARLTAIIDEKEPEKAYLVIDGDEKHTLGPVGMRKVFRQIKKHLPQLKQAYGNRVTGARKKWNKKNRDVEYNLTKASTIESSYSS